jgi:glycosyltransferase involved in cell wall biosynthesis
LEERKTIWVINQFAGTPTSGWGERHYYLAQAWLAAGYRVSIISGSYNHLFSQLPAAPRTYNLEPTDGRLFCWVKTPRYRGQSPLRFWSMWVFAWRVLFVPVEALGRPDHIIISSMPIFPVLSAFLLKKRWKAKHLFFEIRDLWPLTLMHLGGFSRWHPVVMVLAWFERFGYRRADKVVSLLPNAHHHINAITGNPAKFAYIPNGLSTNLLADEPLDPDVLAVIPQNKFVVGYTGTFGLANALEYLAEAAALLQQHPQICFVLVGDGYLKDQLAAQAQTLNNLVLVRKIRKNQVQAMLRHFDVCFVGRNGSPLFDHGVSANKYFDYMLAGKPILAANNLIKDPVELSGGGVIVAPDSAEAIAQGVLSLYQMPAPARIALGQKGREYVTKYHDMNYLSSLYLNLFQQP